MWIRRAAWESLKADNAELRRQYSARVALERGNLKDLEARYNQVLERYQELERAVKVTVGSEITIGSGA